MHLKKIKIVTFVSLYCFFLLLLFSEGFISDFQQMRRKVLASSSKETTQQLQIPMSVWTTFPDKEEILYQGSYYDVKSFISEGETVKVTAYKDTFELILKAVSKNLHSKNKKSHPNNSKKSFVFCFSNISDIQLFSNPESKSKRYYHNYTLKNTYSFSFFRPPSLV